MTEAAAPGQGTKKILIVDDESMARQTLATYLKRAGYDIAMATDSSTVLSVALREKPDAILLDIGLPGGDGMVILENFKANPTLAKIPVIMMSGQDAAKYQERSMRIGATAYLSKPFKNDVLLEALRKSINED